MRKQGACWVDELEPQAEGSRTGGWWCAWVWVRLSRTRVP